MDEESIGKLVMMDMTGTQEKCNGTSTESTLELRSASSQGSTQSVDVTPEASGEEYKAQIEGTAAAFVTQVLQDAKAATAAGAVEAFDVDKPANDLICEVTVLMDEGSTLLQQLDSETAGGIWECGRQSLIGMLVTGIADKQDGDLIAGVSELMDKGSTLLGQLDSQTADEICESGRESLSMLVMDMPGPHEKCNCTSTDSILVQQERTKPVEVKQAKANEVLTAASEIAPADVNVEPMPVKPAEKHEADPTYQVCDKVTSQG